MTSHNKGPLLSVPGKEGQVARQEGSQEKAVSVFFLKLKKTTERRKPCRVSYGEVGCRVFST